MKNLPNDYSRCINDTCELRNNCLRYTDKGTTKYMTLTMFEVKNGKCNNFIKYDNNKHKEPQKPTVKCRV